MKAQRSFVLCRAGAIQERAREDSRAATQEGRACTHNKVPVIMDYEIFGKQVYRRTGGQRDSIVVVTDSIQREIRNSGIFLASYLPCSLWAVLRGTSTRENETGGVERATLDANWAFGYTESLNFRGKTR